VHTAEPLVPEPSSFELINCQVLIKLWQY